MYLLKEIRSSRTMVMLIQVQVELQKLVGVGLVITLNKVSLPRIMMLEKQKMLNPKGGRKLIIFKPKF